MKKFAALILTAVLLLLCCGCATEPVTDEPVTREAVIRYEAGAAYYMGDGAELTMELNFAEPVPAQKELTLRKGEKTVLSFTLTQAVSLVKISAEELEKNVDYTLLVDGVEQTHGKTAGSQIGYIPDPQEPTIPVEIQDVTEATTQTTDEGDGLGQPPTVADLFGQIETIGSVFDQGQSDSQSGGELPSEPFNPEKEQSDSTLTEQISPTPERNASGFRLDGKTTVFHSVRDAS